MALKQITVSDLTGDDIPEGQEATLTVSDHPSLGGRTVELDIEAEDAERFESSKLSMVSVAIHVPGKPVKRVVLDVTQFEKLFPKGKVEEILSTGRPGGMAQSPARRGRPSNSAGSRTSVSSAPKTDYSSLENAGRPHRGRITEAEAEVVRNNLDEINERLAKEGARTIDPSNDEMKSKYGL